MTDYVVLIENELEKDASIAWQAAKDSAAYVEGVLVKEVGPALLKQFFALIEQIGESAVADLFTSATPVVAAVAPPSSDASPASDTVA